jgi:hypothetical protein
MLLSQELLPRKRASSEDVLRATADRALAADVETRPIEEMGRILTLLIGANFLDDAHYETAALKAWHALLASTFDSEKETFVWSPQAARGWGHTPGQLAIAFDVLGQLIRIPEERSTALQRAGEFLHSTVIEDRVQLVSPMGIWTVHTQFPCSGFAPVFASHRGLLPHWFQVLP